MTFDNNSSFSIGIIGSGPIGLECGLHAMKRGYQFIILESGDDIAHNVRSWSHVRLFTPLDMNMSLLGKTLLGNEHENNSFVTGGEYIEHYLRPVSRLLQSNIRLCHRVVSVGRHRPDKFIILVENNHSGGGEEYLIVDCLIDASGTYSYPNYIGPGHLPAINERALRSITPSPITYRIPNVDDEQLAGKRIVLVGKGHSAATSALLLGECAIIAFELYHKVSHLLSLIDFEKQRYNFFLLANLKETHPETQLFWIIRQSVDRVPYCCDPKDPLEQRRRLAESVNQIYVDERIFTKIFTETVVTKLISSSSSATIDITLDTTPPQILHNIDYIIANTGSQPDRSLYENLNVQECYRTKGPLALAVKLLSSGSADCLTQTTYGAHSMLTTEKNFFIVGNKSYGKQTNFLLKIGFEQVNEVFQLIDEQR